MCLIVMQPVYQRSLLFIGTSNAFGAHAEGKLTKEFWAEIRKTSRERSKEHANTLWAHYESKWYFRDGEARPREPKVIDEGEAPEA